MLFSVGYRVQGDGEFTQEIIKNKQKIREVYFSWGDFPSGRNKTTEQQNMTAYEAMNITVRDLIEFSKNGIKLNLLFNGNCYGGDSLSRSLFEKIGDTIEYIKNNFGLESITTTSPIIAKFVKNNFENIKTRASVNMEIGSIEGFNYLEKYFDGFYLKREYNRNIKKIKELKEYLESTGKTLHLLANSGCLNYCSAHVFHDNLVSHESEIVTKDNAYDFFGACYEFLQNEENTKYYFERTNFIRPEDIYLYEGFFESVKLATRVNVSPVKILKAYIDGKYDGFITDLLEPDHGKVLYPTILDNTLIPEEFGSVTMNCNKQCKNCDYCKKIYEKCAVKVTDKYEENLC